MLLSLVLLLLTTLFLLLSPCDWGKENTRQSDSHDSDSVPTLNKPLGAFRLQGKKLERSRYTALRIGVWGPANETDKYWYHVDMLSPHCPVILKKCFHLRKSLHFNVWRLCWNCSLLEVEYEQKQQLVSQQVYSETIWTQQVAFASIFSQDPSYKFAFAVVLLQAATQPNNEGQSHKLYFKKSL